MMIRKALKHFAAGTFFATVKKKLQPARPFEYVLGAHQKLLRKNGYNLCYNRLIRRDYDSRYRNILVAIESPAIIQHFGWLPPEMEFYAEISFTNFCRLDNYFCCRTLYATNDNFVDLDLLNEYQRKDRLVSLIYSANTHLTGHQFRHAMAQEFADRLDLFGRGMGVPLDDKRESLDAYMFQVVIENGKYPEYVSEKFFDCLKTKTIPIYWGGDEGVRKMGFDTRGVISFDTAEELSEILSRLSPEHYFHLRPYAEANLRRLIELRNEARSQFFLSALMPGYLHSTASYHQVEHGRLRLEWEQFPSKGQAEGDQAGP